MRTIQIDDKTDIDLVTLPCMIELEPIPPPSSENAVWSNYPMDGGRLAIRWPALRGRTYHLFLGDDDRARHPDFVYEAMDLGTGEIVIIDLRGRHGF